MAKEDKDEKEEKDEKPKKPAKESGKGKGDAEDGDAEGGDGKKSKKKLIIIAAAAVLLLGGIGGGLYFSSILGGHGEEEAASEESASEESAKDEHGEAAGKGEHGEKDAHGKDGKGKEAKATVPGAPIFYDLPEFLVNLNTGGKQTSFIKMKIALELPAQEDVAMVEANLPRIMDSFNTYLRELRSSDLAGSAGLYRLKEELMMRINKTLYPNKVNDVLFREILVQ